MSDVTLFIIVFGGLFILRILAATIVFALLLPQGDRCPNCDAVTMRLAAPLLDRWLPWFRRSWCLSCGWRGMLRRGPLTPQAEPRSVLTRH